MIFSRAQAGLSKVEKLIRGNPVKIATVWSKLRTMGYSPNGAMDAINNLIHDGSIEILLLPDGVFLAQRPIPGKGR